MKNQPLADKTLPHQIVIIATSHKVLALDGQWTASMGMSVTCNCYRIGMTNHFSKVMSPLPVEDGIPHAWKVWNHRSMHLNQSEFKPNERTVERYGISI